MNYANAPMKPYLAELNLEDIRPLNEVPIQRRDSAAGPYWTAGDFCGLGKSDILPDCDLTGLEWMGNEIRVDGPSETVKLLTRGMGIVAAWKHQMEREFSETQFDICLSIDEGDEAIPPSLTVRFWAVRNGEHYILPNAVKESAQPVLFVFVNA